MTYFEWDTSLDVNVQAMNEQHKTLIDLMNDLHTKNESGRDKQELIEAAEALIAYTQKHFEDEEQYMESIGYSGLESHKKLHETLLTELVSRVEAFSAGQDPKLGDEFTTFLKTWLATHIRGIDTKYGYGL